MNVRYVCMLSIKIIIKLLDFKCSASPVKNILHRIIFKEFMCSYSKLTDAVKHVKITNKASLSK